MSDNMMYGPGTTEQIIYETFSSIVSLKYIRYAMTTWNPGKLLIYKQFERYPYRYICYFTKCFIRHQITCNNKT